jgi:hypothetical protein
MQHKALGIPDATTRLLKKNRKNAACSDHPPLSASTIHTVKSGAANDATHYCIERHWRSPGSPSGPTATDYHPCHTSNSCPRASAPDYIGYCDASAFGAGGVWFSGQCPLPETVWRLQWPANITAAVISESNPTGTLANSDLEMAAVVFHLNVLEPLVPSMHHKSTHIHSDNTPSVAWLTKMATKTAKSDAAHHLVRGLALHQRMLHSAPVNITHVAGLDNNLADIASRAITQLDHDHAFLTHFDTLFPVQERSWQRASHRPRSLAPTWLCPLPTSLSPSGCATRPPNPRSRFLYTPLTRRRPLVPTLTPHLAEQRRRIS